MLDTSKINFDRIKDEATLAEETYYALEYLGVDLVQVYQERVVSGFDSLLVRVKFRHPKTNEPLSVEWNFAEGVKPLDVISKMHQEVRERLAVLSGAV